MKYFHGKKCPKCEAGNGNLSMGWIRDGVVKGGSSNDWNVRCDLCNWEGHESELKEMKI